jgi:hypothetical protein
VAVEPSEEKALAIAEQRQFLMQTFPVLGYEATELADLVRENLGVGQMPRLQRIPWPTGGELQFNLQTDEGTQKLDRLTGIILYHTPNRSYWVKPFAETGGGEPPDCSSPDGLSGYGMPGTDHPQVIVDADGNVLSKPPYACGRCPRKDFGDNNARPACRETHPLFMVLASEDPEDVNLLPIVVALPPSALTIWRNYSGFLLNKGISYRRAVTEISLAKQMGGPKKNIAYSEAVLRRVTTLPNEEYMRVRSYAEAMEPLFERFKNTAVDADETLIEGTAVSA